MTDPNKPTMNLQQSIDQLLTVCEDFSHRLTYVENGLSLLERKMQALSIPTPPPTTGTRVKMEDVKKALHQELQPILDLMDDIHRTLRNQ